MFDFYVIPVIPTEPVPVVWVATQRSEEWCADFSTHITRSYVMVTFAGVLPDFSMFYGERVVTVLCMDAPHATC